jgi:hypothetical protein
MVIWYIFPIEILEAISMIFPRFGMLYQCKSGKPGSSQPSNRCRQDMDGQNIDKPLQGDQMFE